MKTPNIYSAILKIQDQLPHIEKDSLNPHLKNKYASLANILSTILPMLNAEGVILTSHVSELDNSIYVVRLYHVESDTSLSSHIKLINMADMQKWGGSMTYATRYGLLSLLGIAADMDDDGETAVTPPPLTDQLAKRNKVITDILLLIKEKEKIIAVSEDEKSKFIRSVIMDPSKLDSIKTLDKLNEIYFWIKSL